MSHKRTQIRAAFVSLLTGETSADDRVYSSRVRPIWNEELPALNVWTDEETAEILNEQPRIYRRTLQVVIEAYTNMKEDVDLNLDLLSDQIGYTVDTHDLFSLKEHVAEIIYTGSQYSISGEGTKQAGVAILRFDVIYFTTAGERTVGLPGLETIGADWESRAEDEIALPQV